MNILIVATHPDDEVLGCGGVIARHVAKGDHVVVIVVTRGVPEIFPPELIERIRGELRMAADVLGVKEIIFLDFPAPQLDAVPGHKLADAMTQNVRNLQPHTIYLPHRGDIHADHQAVYLATLVAARPVPGCSVRELLCYETLSETEWAPPTGDMVFIPTVFIDISDHLESKLNAMRCYQTQLKPFPSSRSIEAIEALAKFRGVTVGLPAAEAFMLVRQIVH